jgi:hypothetical protein
VGESWKGGGVQGCRDDCLKLKRVPDVQLDILASVLYFPQNKLYGLVEVRMRSSVYLTILTGYLSGAEC